MQRKINSTMAARRARFAGSLGGFVSTNSRGRRTLAAASRCRLHPPDGAAQGRVDLGLHAVGSGAGADGACRGNLVWRQRGLGNPGPVDPIQFGPRPVLSIRQRCVGEDRIQGQTR